MRKKTDIQILLLVCLAFCMKSLYAQNQLSSKGVYLKIPSSSSLLVTGASSDMKQDNSGVIEIGGTLTIEGSLTNDNSSDITIESGAELTAEVDFTNDNSASVTVENTGIFNIDGNFLNDNAATVDLDGTINLEGNWTNNAESDIGDGDGIYGTVCFGGTALQNYSGTLETYFENIIVDNTSNLQLSFNMRVDQTLTFTNGSIITGANRLHINNSSATAIQNYTDNKSITGNLRRDVTAGNLYYLPVSTNTNYELLTFNLVSASGLDYIDISFTEDGTQTPPGGLQVNNTNIDQLLDYGYWTITPDAGTYTYDLTVKSTGHSDLGGTSDQYALISDIGSGWQDIGTHNISSQEYNASYVIAKRYSLTSGGSSIV